MKLTDVEKRVLLSAISTHRNSLVHDPEDPYKNLMECELLDACEEAVRALPPDNNKYNEKP